MNRVLRWLVTCAMFALLIFPACGPNSKEIPVAASTPSADQPHPVNDLSSLSSANPLDPFGKQDLEIARQVTSDARTGTSGNIDAIGTARHVGDDRHPGEEKLINKKSAQFATLSMRVMDQVFNRVEELEDQDPISHLKLPTDLKPVIVTGTLNRDGKLRELVVEQHSGQAAVDRMIIAACKKGLFIQNPPPDAMSSSEGYKLRLETRMENYASVDGEHWEFKTYLGLALL